MQIQELVLEHIQHGRFKLGDALPSYPWLSQHLGVADKTVRQAYANLRLLGVLEIRKGKGTFVARERWVAGNAQKEGMPQFSATDYSVGILAPVPQEGMEDVPMWRLFGALQATVLAERLDVVVFARPADLRGSGLSERIRDHRRVGGLVVMTPVDPDFLRRLQAFNVPLVLADQPAGDMVVDQVVFDHAGAARDLTYRLIGMGHRRIGFLRGDPAWAESEHESGFRHALGAAELPVPPAWVIEIRAALGETGEAAIDALLDEGITAVVATSASLASTVLACAARRGLSVPARLSVGVLLDRPCVGGSSSSPKLEGQLFETSTLASRTLKRLQELRAGHDPLPRRDVIAAERLIGETAATPAAL